MKKTLLTLLAGALFGCNQPSTNPDTSNNPQGPSQNHPPTVEISTAKAALQPQAEFTEDDSFAIYVTGSDVDGDPVSVELLENGEVIKQGNQNLEAILNKQPGTYTYTGSAYDGKETTSKDLTVTITAQGNVDINLAPTANFTATPISATVGTPITFTDQTTDNTPGWTCTYFFGDDSSSNECNTTHTYLTSGEKTVTLVVTDKGGLTDSISKTVTITNPPTIQAPFFDFIRVDTSVVTGNFQALLHASDPQNLPVTYAVIDDSSSELPIKHAVLGLDEFFYTDFGYTVTNHSMTLVIGAWNSAGKGTTTTIYSPVSDKPYAIKVFYHNGTTTVESESLEIAQPLAEAICAVLPGCDPSIETIFQADATVNPSEADAAQQACEVFMDKMKDPALFRFTNYQDNTGWKLDGSDNFTSTLWPLYQSVCTDSSGDGKVYDTFGADTTETNPLRIFQIKNGSNSF